MEVVGTVFKRGPDSFIMRDQTGMEWVVALTPHTDVRSYTEGVFPGGSDHGASYMLRGRRLEEREYTVSYILRGLRLEVSGSAKAQGELVADKVRVDEDDLRTAQAQQAAGSNNGTNGIWGLEDFDTVRTISVPFSSGSSDLDPEAKAAIDRAAADWVTRQNAAGWVVVVVGFADTTGDTEANRKLSEHRAHAVIGYLANTRNLPVRRLLQPFGCGESNPIVENTAVEGRAEISFLATRGTMP